jgi:hypothetical protein
VLSHGPRQDARGDGKVLAAGPVRECNLCASE